MVKTQKKSLKVGKLVNSTHVDTAIRNYKQNRWVHNSRRLGKEDSLSIWYSLEELQEFFEIAQQNGADGVRMYFGAYDENYTEQPLYAGRQTIMLVATRNRATEDGTSDKDIYIQTNQGTSILAYNAGRPCPPVCSSFGGGIDDNGEIGITIVDKGDDGLVIA
ncbi:MAG: hypothetical protein ACK4E0_10150 [Chitinophagaceae bacterium]|jgi:hypothetical protein